jgi:formate hydrogenlyase transcriptional activator
MMSSSAVLQTIPDGLFQRFETLQRVIAEIVSYRDGQVVVERFGDELRKFVQFDYVVISVIDEASREVRFKSLKSYTGDHDDLQVPHFTLAESPSGVAYDTKTAVVIPDWKLESEYPRLRDFLLSVDIRSSCVLPLATPQRRVGTLALGISAVDAYSEEEVRFLRLVADQLALAVDSAISFELTNKARAELEVKKDRLQLMLDLTNRLVSNLELSDLLMEVSSTVRRVMNADAVGVALPEKEQDAEHLRFFALDFPDGKGFLTTETRCPIATSPLGMAFRSGVVQLRNRSEIERDCPEAANNPALREGLSSGCFLPLISHGRSLGILALSRFAEGEFTPEEIAFLEQIARQIAIAVENALAYGEIAELKEKLSQEKLYLEDEIRGEFDCEGIVGQSPGLRSVLQLVGTVASSDSTVLLLGETGTGKELIARAIHDRSRRKERTFVKMNCAAIPTGLLESELFGHERGAFTGAVTQKLGRLELADRGTLFLDEIGDIPLELQPKLLRALQEREFERLGSVTTKKVDVRLIAATNRNLEQMMEDNEFRSDLYYRLNVFPIRIPPLRERPEDIPLLVHYFTQKYARRMEKQIESIPSNALKRLGSWPWPGNIRELENFVERAVILTRGKSLEIPLTEIKTSRFVPARKKQSAERDDILRALEASSGRVGGEHGAAARLGLKRTTLISRMKKLGIANVD